MMPRIIVPMILATSSALLVGGVVGPVVAAQEEAANTDGEKTPPPRRDYMGRRIAPTMHYSHAEWLTRDRRQREEDSDAMHKTLRIKPGHVVCDMGCGNGYHTLRLAKAVGRKGKVYAVDIQKEMLEMLDVRAKRHGLENIIGTHSSVVDPSLPDNSLDLILLVDVYHEFSHPELMLRAMRRSLKRKGVIVLVEFRAEDPDVPIRPLHKMSKKQILKEIPANGFALVREYDELPWQHVMFFGRDDADEDADEDAKSSLSKEGVGTSEKP